ncbi:MAG: hypothetical protein ACR2HN_14450 [Tepidiformaceae bacterium]
MGFYYGSSQPPEEDKPSGFRETVGIVWGVFRVLALPVGLLMGALLSLLLLFWLFTVHALAGFGAIAVVVLAVAARGLWEARHPPDLR